MWVERLGKSVQLMPGVTRRFANQGEAFVEQGWLTECLNTSPLVLHRKADSPKVIVFLQQDKEGRSWFSVDGETQGQGSLEAFVQVGKNVMLNVPTTKVITKGGLVIARQPIESINAHENSRVLAENGARSVEASHSEVVVFTDAMDSVNAHSSIIRVYGDVDSIALSSKSTSFAFNADTVRCTDRKSSAEIIDHVGHAYLFRRQQLSAGSIGRIFPA